MIVRCYLTIIVRSHLTFVVMSYLTILARSHLIIIKVLQCWKIAQLDWLMQGWSCVSYLCTISIGHSDIIVVIVFLKPSQWSYYISTHKNCNCSELAEFPWFGDSSCESYWSSIRSGKSGVSGDLCDLFERTTHIDQTRRPVFDKNRLFLQVGVPKIHQIRHIYLNHQNRGNSASSEKLQFLFSVWICDNIIGRTSTMSLWSMRMIHRWDTQDHPRIN